MFDIRDFDERFECEKDGIKYVATIHHDDSGIIPWEEFDGHGPVSDWERRDKAPGEMILCNDRSSNRFYDFAEACKIALRDGWGCNGGRREGETKRAYAARAAMADYEYLRRFCNGDWCYVGVAVQAIAVLEDGSEIELTDEYSHACWGIDSDSREHIVDIANEELSACEKEAKEALKELGAMADKSKA